jgi:hypothetical protein
MKKTWNKPSLTTYGEVENLTQRTKTLGKNDGVLLDIPGLTPPGGTPIGS